MLIGGCGASSVPFEVLIFQEWFHTDKEGSLDYLLNNKVGDRVMVFGYIETVIIFGLVSDT